MIDRTSSPMAVSTEAFCYCPHAAFEFFRRARFALIGVILITISVSGCIEISFEGRGPIATLEAGEGKKIFIFAESEWEVSRGILYEVRTLEGVQVKRTLFMFAWPDDVNRLGFKLVRADGSDLVGVVENRDPKKLLIIHDFQTGESWCAHRGFKDPAFRALGERLLKRLTEEIQDEGYRLGD